jgi:hypothetical protein
LKKLSNILTLPEILFNVCNYLFNYYITFLIYNAKISDNNAESGKVPRMLEAFPRWMAKEILSKRNFLDFESPDSAISRSPMTLMKSIVSFLFLFFHIRFSSIQILYLILSSHFVLLFHSISSFIHS